MSGVIAFGETLYQCEQELKASLEGWLIVVADDKKTAPLQDFVAGVPGQQDTGRSWCAGGEG